MHLPATVSALRQDSNQPSLSRALSQCSRISIHASHGSLLSMSSIIMYVLLGGTEVYSIRIDRNSTHAVVLYKVAHPSSCP